MRIANTCLALAAVMVAASTSPAAVEVIPEKAGGVYEVNEPIRYTVRDTEAKPFAVHYIFRHGQQTTIGEGDHASQDGASFTVETRLDSPGTVLLEVRTQEDATGSIGPRLLRGAVVAPERLVPVAPAPDDFDAFWASKVEELAAVPMNAALDPAPATTQPTDAAKPVDYFRITLDNIRGGKVRGQLAVPQTPGKHPALLIVQWAGVYPLEKPWAVDKAADGWLTLNILAHDLPIDEPKDFYKRQFDGPLRNYWAIGNDDRDASYFLRMYLSCYRAADYLASRDDWDGTLVVMGTSQGGLQALMTAGLHPKITGAIANVSAGCDYLGEEAGRKSGWP